MWKIRRDRWFTEAGGVILDLLGPGDVRDAWMKLRNGVPALTGVMVQRFVPARHEIMIGVTYDEQYGHLISFGLGGVMVKAWGDIQVRLAPLAERDVEDLIRESKAARLPAHSRGGPAADVAAARHALLRVSEMVRTIPDIREADFNPVAVHAAGVGIDVFDARIRLAGQREK